MPWSDPRKALLDGGHGEDGYGAAMPLSTDYKMQAPRAYGLGARRQMNCLSMLLALVVPVCFFVATFCLMSFELYFKHPETSRTLVAMAIFLVLVIGTGAIQAHKKQLACGERSWWSFIFLTSLVAAFVGSSLGYVNYSWNTRRYYEYISLRKAVDVNPGQNQGQQLLDAGEINFKAGAKVDRTMNMAYHQSRTWCVAPITSSDGALLASYDFWAVGMDCCSSKPGDFSCAPDYKPSATDVHELGAADSDVPAGLRVMDNSEIAGYTLAVEQATSAYSIQTGHPIFLYMMNSPYVQIKSYFKRGKTFATVTCFVYLIIQGIFVAYQSYLFGQGAKSGYLDIEKMHHSDYIH